MRSEFKIKRLYVSTDDLEALIDPRRIKNHQYHDIDVRDGEELTDRMGFNPMSYVEFNDSISNRVIEAIAIGLLKEGLFVTAESPNGRVKKYPRKDIEIRDELVKLSLQKGRSGWYLLLYSNNPYEIKEFDYRNLKTI